MKLSKVVYLSILTSALLFTGCGGSDGSDGTDGAPGANGTDGADGADGFTSLLSMSDEPIGVNCSFGGVKIETGLDTNENGVLDTGEVNQAETEYICSDEATADTIEGLVYTADKTIDDTYELFANLNGQQIKLASPSKVGESITDISVSPDKTKVAYRVGGKLYIVDLLKRSAPVQVHPEAVTGGEVGSFAWSPDGSKLAYNGDLDTVTLRELYTVSADGSLEQKINPPLSSNKDVLNFKWSPNSKSIAYRADTVNDYAYNLLVYRFDTNTNSQVSPTAVSLQDVTYYEWSPESNKIAYKMDDVTNDVFDLYIATDLSGTARTKVTPALASDQVVSNIAWQPEKGFSINGNVHYEVAYLLNDSGSTITNIWRHTYHQQFGSLPVTTDTKITNYPSSSKHILSFKWSPDGNMLAYNGDIDTSWVYELYTIDRNDLAAPAVKINQTLVAYGNIIEDYGWAPDSSKIAYGGDIEVNGQSELFTVDPDGTNRMKVNETLDPNEDVAPNGWQWSKDSTAITYKADQDTDNVIELYTRVLSESNSTKVSGTLPDYADVSNFKYIQ